MKTHFTTTFFLIVFFTITVIVNQDIYSQPKLLWDTDFGTSYEYNFGTSQITTDGGIIYMGFKQNGFYISNPWIRKYDANGKCQWDKTYGIGYKGEANSIKQTPDGGYILTGRAMVSDNYDLWILKMDANGDSAWSKIYKCNHTATGNDILPNPDGTCLVVGQIEMPDQFFNLMKVFKINEIGDTLWTKYYKNSLSYCCVSLVKCLQGGYAGLAIIDSTYEAAFYYQIIRFDDNGDTLWTKPLSSKIITSISLTSDGGFAVTGAQHNGNDWDLLLMKTNSKGVEEWSKTYGGIGFDAANEAKQTNDGGYNVGGYTSSFGEGGNYNATLLKTDKNGNMIWSDTIGGSENNERAMHVFVTSDNGYYVTGNVKHIFWVAKYEPDTLTEEPIKADINKSYLLSFNLSQNYPNPFSSTTSFDYFVPKASRVTISVFNLSGSEVIRLANNSLSSGRQTITWDGKDMHGNKISSGIYYYQMIVEDSSTKTTSKSIKKLVFYK